MKKLLATLLLLTLMLTGILPAALAGEPFHLHSNTTFDMSMSEIRAQEKAHGFVLDMPHDKRLKGVFTIAGVPDTELNYYFWDGALVEMYYKFPDGSTYNTLENALIELYGETEYSSRTGMTLPKYERSYSTGGHPNVPTSNAKNMPDFSQRLVAIDGGRHILIDHFYNSIGGHKIIYTILAPEEYAHLTGTSSILDDL